jgi:hypothetical protein
MPSTSFLFNDEYFTTTLYAATKKIVDQLDYSLPLLAEEERIHGKGKPSIEGGNRLTIGLNFSEHSETTELVTGYEPINYNITEIGTPGIDDWADAIRPVLISGHDKRINRGSEHKLLDIVEERGKATMSAFRRQLHKRKWGLQNTGLSDINTLNGFDFTDGFLEAAAIGSQSNVVHGISKATYAFSVGWQNSVFDGAGSFNLNGLTGLDFMMIDIMTKREIETGKACWYASTSAFANLKRAVRSQEQYVDARMLDTGMLSLTYNGYKVLPNRDMPNAGATTTADPWSFAFIDHESIKNTVNGSDYFRTGEFVSQSGYDVSAAPIHLMMQYMTDYLGTSAVLFDADAW